MRKPQSEALVPVPTVLQRRILMACLVAAAAFLVFSNSLGNGFLWDDEQFLLKNAYLSSWRFLPRLFTENVVAGAGLQSNLYRPLQLLTHFLDLLLWGLNPFGHHLTNVLLHAGSSAAVFLWLSRLAPALAALAVSLLYCLHPLQCFAVAYVSGRGDTLAILFGCLALLFYERRLWASLLCAALALLSKESAAILPALLWLHVRAAGLPRGWRREVPFWALSAAYILVRLTALNFLDTLNFYGTENILTLHPSYRLFTYLTTLPEGLRLWLWPSDLHHERSWPVYASFWLRPVWASALGVIAWGAASAWLWRRDRPAAAGPFLWFVTATLPTSNLIFLINALFYDHWFLLPGLGLALAFARAFAIAWKAGVSELGAAALAAALAFLAVGHNRVWRDALSLNGHILRFEPDNAKAHNNLAMALVDEGRLEEAVRHYRKAIEMSDQYPQTHHNLGRAYEALGRLNDAEAEYRRALRLDPRFHHSYIALGWLELRRGQKEFARTAFEGAIEVYPYDARAYLGLALVEVESRRRERAAQVLERGVAATGDPALLDFLGKVRSAKK